MQTFPYTDNITYLLAKIVIFLLVLLLSFVLIVPPVAVASVL